MPVGSVVIPDALILAAVPILAASGGWVIRYVLTLQKTALGVVNTDAVDDAKDDLIATLEANHKALEQRVELLEDTLSKEKARADRLEADLRVKTAEFEALRPYAAPEGFALLETSVTSSARLMENVLARLTSIEDRQIASIEALGEAITLLREVVADGSRK